MRHAMWMCIGLALGCALCAYVVPEGLFLPVAAAFVVCSLAGLLLGRRWTRCAIGGLVCLGCALGVGWFALFHSLYLAPAMAAQDTVQDTALVASGYGYETDYGWALEGRLTLKGKTYPVRVYLEDSREIQPGDILRGSFRLRYTAPRQGELTSRYQGEGIFLLADPRGQVTVEPGDRGHIRYLPARLARKIQGILETVIPQDAYPFALALMLGQDDLLSYQDDTAFKLSGIRHVIAVSGLHVTLLYSVVSILTLKNRFLTALIGLPVLLIFSGAAGFTPSVNRSAIMVGLMMLGELVNREYDPPTGLGLACAGMLLVNPLVVTSVSFQLSALCVAGILWQYGPIRDWLLNCLSKDPKSRSRWKNALASSAAMSLSSMIFTTPLSAAYFGTVSLVGVVTNLVAVPLTNGIFLGLILCCGASLLLPGLAGLLGRLLAWPIRLTLAIARLLSRGPLAAVFTASPYILLWLILVYCLLFVLLLSRKKQPAVLLLCAVLTLCAALGLSWAEPLRDECRLTALDVGQGQCLLFQSQGKNILVDCGGTTDAMAADAAANFLSSQGVGRLDAILVTHGDRDHTGGLEKLLTRVTCDTLILPATAGGLARLQERILWVDRETELTFPGVRIRIFPPIFSEEDNENSLCILFQTENCDILVTGDRSRQGERLLLKQFDLPRVELLIAGHHGSGNATSQELLDAVRPDTVILSLAAGNLYGHPAPELLERLNALGCQIYRTDLHGTIIYRR